MAGLELFTRNSLSSLRSSSEASILISESLKNTSDEDSWSWSYLREQFRIKNAEGLYHRYQARLQHALFIVGLMLNIAYSLVSLILYFVVTKDYQIYGCTVSISMRVISLVIYIVVFITALKEPLFKTDYSRIVVSTVIVMAMLLTEHGTSVFHITQSISPHHSIRHSFYIITVCYILLPYPKIYQSLMAGIVASVIELSVSAFTYYSTIRNSDKGERIAADVVFYFVISLVCLYIKFLLELANRRAFLDRRQCFESKFILEYEKDQEEQLLLSILPKHMAVKVRDDIRAVIRSLDHYPLPQRPFNQLYVEKHTNVSILYADIVNSMLLTASLNVSELVHTLNELFGRFDECAEKNCCMRIKLLGDCYYCVSGVPNNDPFHADHCVQMGLDMIEIIRKIRDERRVNVDMRIGAHSGNILSGLLGLRKWQFDIWSRDVTIASRMEQSGKAGRVHITSATKNQLKGVFDLQPGNGHLRDPYLAEHNIETFLIAPRPKKFQRETIYDSPADGTYRVPHRLRRSSISIHKNDDRSCGRHNSGPEVLSSRKRIVLDYSLMQYRRMVTHVNRFMESEIDSMPLSKQDQWFRSEGIQPIFITFQDRSMEIPYNLQPDPLFKYYLLCVLLLFIGMTCIHLLAMEKTYYFWLAYGITFLIIAFCSVGAWTGYLWSKWKGEEPKPPALSSDFFTKVSSRITHSTILRIVVCFVISILMVSCAMLGLGSCNHSPEAPAKDQSNSTTVLTYTTNETNQPVSCQYPWYFTFCAVLSMTTVTVFLRINFFLKFIINFTALTGFCYVISQREGNVFSQDRLHFSDWHDVQPAVGHCWYLIVVWCTLHTLDRQVEYVSRLDYLCKRKLREEQEETKSVGLLNKMLLQNILPTHVAEYYLNKDYRRSEELYHEQYTSVAVMFASIPNYTDFYTENIINDEGLRCLQLLNEIICDFDKLLYEQAFLKIEKIKTVGSTYMAAAGLQPGRNSYEAPQINRTENPVANVLLLVRFSTVMMATLKQMNKDAWQNFQLRIGIAVGPVIAGVVGAIKPQYDIWGDTVNMASRMDTTGQMGRIHVTREVADILIKDGTYSCESRGEIYVKGKGQIVTYLVKTEYDEHGDEMTRL